MINLNIIASLAEENEKPRTFKDVIHFQSLEFFFANARTSQDF